MPLKACTRQARDHAEAAEEQDATGRQSIAFHDSRSPIAYLPRIYKLLPPLPSRDGRRFGLLNANTGTYTELFKPGGPCIAPLASGTELLVCKGNVGLVVGPDGRASRRAGLTWSDQSTALAMSHPYAVALLPNYVEIRSVHRVSANGLAQVYNHETWRQAVNFGCSNVGKEYIIEKATALCYWMYLSGYLGGFNKCLSSRFRIDIAFAVAL